MPICTLTGDHADVLDFNYRRYTNIGGVDIMIRRNDQRPALIGTQLNKRSTTTTEELSSDGGFDCGCEIAADGNFVGAHLYGRRVRLAAADD